RRPSRRRRSRASPGRTSPSEIDGGCRLRLSAKPQAARTRDSHPRIEHTMWRAALTLACVAAWAGTAAGQADDLDTLQHKAVKAAVQRVAPYVVTIETSGGTEFLGAGGGRRILRGTGPTTGLIVAADGHVITSAFNFANKPSSIFVTVAGRKE